MARDKEANFTPETKQLARERAHFNCEDCGQNTYLEIHHILPLYVAALKYPNIGASLLRSLENCQCLCPNCHSKRHEKGWVEWDYSEQVNRLLALAGVAIMGEQTVFAQAYFKALDSL